MQIKIENSTENPVNLLRRAGYVFQRREGLEMSFIRPLAMSGFPRFHIYAKTENGVLVINLHLDQKKATYGQSARHHGEYEGAILEEERRRIATLAESE